MAAARDTDANALVLSLLEMGADGSSGVENKRVASNPKLALKTKATLNSWESKLYDDTLHVGTNTFAFCHRGLLHYCLQYFVLSVAAADT
jgi:hypothetical protein